MIELSDDQMSVAYGGVIPLLTIGYYAARGAVALYALYEAGKYAGNQVYK